MRIRCATLAGRFRSQMAVQFASLARGQVQDFHLRHKYMANKTRYPLLRDRPLVSEKRHFTATDMVFATTHLLPRMGRTDKSAKCRRDTANN